MKNETMPRLYGEKARRKVAYVRITTAEHAEMAMAANRLGISISQYLVGLHQNAYHTKK